MFILNGSNYTDGKAVMRDFSGEIVAGGMLRIYSEGALVDSCTIGLDGSSEFSVVPGVLYVFEIYDAHGVLVSVLDPVMYEQIGGGEGGGDDSLVGRIGSLERGLASESAVREQADYATAVKLADANSRIAANEERIVEESIARENSCSDLESSIESETISRENADAEIITSLEDETTARRLNDELLQQQIEEVAVQTDWEQDNATALDYLKNKPTSITTAEIEALFI